ncbi:MAG TPA: hypothetical protein EYH42_00960, partial [Sulfurovum sp.]|nr:hypothetical protein [Sulfurovum sp.]
MTNSLLYLDPNNNKVLVTDEVIYTQTKVIPEEVYTLVGSVFMDKKETEKKVLLLIQFGDTKLSKELSLKSGLSYSERYGAFKYLTANKNNKFSLSFTIPKNEERVILGIRNWYNKYDVYISSELVLKKETVSKISMGSIGFCLSNMVVNRLLERFGGKKLFHVYRHRSDQFVHNYIKKDRPIIPREYIENNLKIKASNTTDPNFVSSQQMLDDQYDKLGKHGVSTDRDFFEILENEKLDIIVLDNYVDMGAILAYPKLKGFESSSVFLRKYEYHNFDEYFTFGKKLTNEESAYYFSEIIKYLKRLQPTAVIYFLHYPYNTYIDNPKRQIRAMEFEDIFQSKFDNVVIVPAFHITKTFQIEDDPAHFDDSIYVAYGGFIHADFVRRKRQLVSHPIMPSYAHMYNREYHTDYLVLTNNYPSFDHYYQNAFIHSRVRAYIENGVHPDVYKMTSEENLEQYCFEAVHVTIGSGKTFDDLLTFHPYKYILVHFLNEMMWNHLRKYIDHTKVLVWVHGYEVQPWHRRSFNYNNDEEIVKAKVLSEKRISFWQKILKDPHPNLKLVFVSQYFADEVMEDLGFELPEESYEIIHNYINTDLFKYEKKP